MWSSEATALAEPVNEAARAGSAATAEVLCYHCGTPCGADGREAEGKAFCCNGCQTVFELLTENGLGDFYRLSATAGVRVNGGGLVGDRFSYLDEPLIRERLVNFGNERLTRVTFRIPSIHCIACVWLLENLFRLEPRIGESRVNLPRKEVDVAFQTQEIKLSEVVTLLATLGYEPELNLSDIDEASARKMPRSSGRRRLWLQVGVAGFAFGNIMLFSIASYLGLDSFFGPTFKRLVG